MIPVRATDLDDLAAEARRQAREVSELLGGAERGGRPRGVDLGRVRFRSPFFALLRFSLGAGFEMLLAHDRRHLWLAREVMASPGFPGGPGGVA